MEEGNIPNTVSYVELFMTPIKMKNNFCDGHHYEMQKGQDGGGIMPIKSLRPGWRRDTLQTQHPM